MHYKMISIFKLFAKLRLFIKENTNESDFFD